MRTAEIYLRLRETRDAQPEKRWFPAYYFDICFLDGTKIGYCDPTNAASSKTCELAGGKYIETVDIPEDNEI